MTTTKTLTALEAARQLFTDKVLGPKALAAAGIGFNHGNSLGLGDPRLIPLIREAGRSEGFGDAPIDLKIRTYLDNYYGEGAWQRERDPWPWEAGGGDAEIDKLFKDRDAAIREREALEAAMWAKKDEYARTFQKFRGAGVISDPILKVHEKELEAALDDWQAARNREAVARARLTTRQLWLQKKYDVANATSGK